MPHNHHTAEKNISVAFFLNLGFTLIEIVGGLYVNSVAILSDALHDLGDSATLGISWYLQRKSTKKANKRFTFGYRRFSLLGALINSIILIAGSGLIIYEAVQRILSPEMSDAKGMIAFAVLGIAVNGYAAWKLSHGKSMNEKVVSWHLIEDVLGWVAVLIGAVVLLFTNNLYIDPVLSIMITSFILFNVAKRLKSTLKIFLQGVPEDIDMEEIDRLICQVKQVESTHHLHVWSLEGAEHVFTAHIKLKPVKNLEEVVEIKNEIYKKLAGFDFTHCAIETELYNEQCVMEKKEL